MESYVRSGRTTAREALRIMAVVLVVFACTGETTTRSLGGRWILRSRSSPTNEGHPPDELLRKAWPVDRVVDDRVEMATDIGNDCVFYRRRRSAVSLVDDYVVCDARVPTLLLSEGSQEWDLKAEGIWKTTGAPRVENGRVVESGLQLTRETMIRAGLENRPFWAGWSAARPVKPVVAPSAAYAIVDVNARMGSSRRTPLMRAASAGDVRLVGALIGAGAEVNATDRYGDTALLLAAGHGACDVVSELVKVGGDINVRNVNGETPLIRAIMDNKENCARLLIVAGADLRQRDLDNKTALWWAKSTNHHELAALIEKAGGTL